MPEFLNQAQATLPSGADYVTPTSGTAAYGSYTQVVASAPRDLAVTGIEQTPFGGFTEGGHTVVDVAHGAAASEVVLAEFAGWENVVSGTWSPDGHGAFTTAGIPIKTITSGTRIAVRVFYSSFAIQLGIAVAYVGVPLGGDLETTTSKLTGILTSTVTSGGSAWASGSYVQVTASTSAAWVVNHIASNSASGVSGLNEMSIATGAAASEVEIAVIPGRPAGAFNPRADALGLMLDNIAASARVALRHRHEVATQTVNVWIGYYAKPL